MSEKSAVIQTGGKQYRVSPGDVIDVERVASDARDDDGQVTFDQVLLVADEDGVRLGEDLASAKVTGKLLDEVRGPKVRVFKFKRRKQYRRTIGHRQDYHRVRIEQIEI